MLNLKIFLSPKNLRDGSNGEKLTNLATLPRQRTLPAAALDRGIDKSALRSTLSVTAINQVHGVRCLVTG